MLFYCLLTGLAFRLEAVFDLLSGGLTFTLNGLKICSPTTIFAAVASFRFELDEVHVIHLSF